VDHGLKSFSRFYCSGYHPGVRRCTLRLPGAPRRPRCNQCGALPSDIRRVDGKFSLYSRTGHQSFPRSYHSDSTKFISTGLLSITLYFNRSLASFKKLPRFDPCSPWPVGTNTCLGPYYNNYSYNDARRTHRAPGFVQRFKLPGQNARKRPGRAMRQRSPPIPQCLPRHLEKTRAAAMKGLAQIPRPIMISGYYTSTPSCLPQMDFWNTDGSPSRTPELVNLCKVILKAEPKQPAALHDYIT